MTSHGLTGGGNGQTPLHPDDLEGLVPKWVRSQGQLDQLERRNVLEGRQWALSRTRPVERVLDDRFVRELHSRCFGNVWRWAGRYRSTNTSIGTDWQSVPVSVRNLVLDAQLWVASTKGGTADSQAARRRLALARLHHQLVAVHPFVNGNGRTARLLVDVLCVSLGLGAPSWGEGAGDARDQYLASLRAADAGDADSLHEFMWS